MTGSHGNRLEKKAPRWVLLLRLEDGPPDYRAAAQQRVRTAERILAEARAKPKHFHDFSRLEDNVAEGYEAIGGRLATAIIVPT
jgi:hypothetical protein